MRFRLVWYDTNHEDRFLSTARYEFLGDRESIWNLWFTLTKKLKCKHVEVFSLDGRQQNLDEGLNGMVDYNV